MDCTIKIKYIKTDELKEKDLRSKVENYRQRAEDTVVSVKSKVEQLKYDSKDNIHADELQAQKLLFNAKQT